jgi:iron complex outermembrane receptor protein
MSGGPSKVRWLWISAVFFIGACFVGINTSRGADAGPAGTVASGAGDAAVAQRASQTGSKKAKRKAKSTVGSKAKTKARTKKGRRRARYQARSKKRRGAARTGNGAEGPGQAAETTKTKVSPAGTNKVPVATVTVKAPRPGSVEAGYIVDTAKNVGPWPNLKLQDAPYSISVMSSDLMQNLQVTSTNDVWKYDPYTQFYIPSSRLGDNMLLRGNYNNRRTQDGLPMYGSYQPIEDKEAVQIMTGVTGFMYGIGSPGGDVNYVTKRAPDQPLADVTVGYAQDTDRYIHGDFGGPLNKSGTLGFRLNAVAEDGQTFLQDSTLNKWLISSSLDWKITDRLKLDLDLSSYYNKQNGMQISFDNAANNAPLSSINPSWVDPYKLYAQKWSFEKDQYTQGGAILKWDINDTFTLRTAVREQFSSDNRLNVNANTIDWAKGTYHESIYQIGTTDYYNTSTYTYLDTSFCTGPISHKLTTGISYSREDAFASPDHWASLAIPGTFYLNNPAQVAEPFFTIDTKPQREYFAYNYTNLVAGDNIKLTDKWSILAGINDAFLDQTNWKLTSGAVSSEYNKSKVTPAAALMFKPWPFITTYFSYLQALEPGGTAPDTYNGQPVKNAGEMMPPSVDDQYEAGAKATLFDRLFLTAAWFDLKQANSYVDPATLYYVQSGQTETKGVELTATGKILPDLRIFGGATFQHAEITTDAASPKLVGKWPTWDADQILKMVLEYDIPRVPGLTLTFGTFHTGSFYEDAANTDHLPGATTFDLGARYQTCIYNRPTIFRLNVSNLTNNHYWMPIGWIGDPLVVHFSTTIKCF